MTTPAQINQTLQIAKQYFEELIRIRSVDQLKQQDYGEGSQRKRVDFLLGKLKYCIANIEKTLADHLQQHDTSPMVEGSPQLLLFYRNELKPNAHLIQEAFLRTTGLWELLPDDLFSYDPLKGLPVLSTIESALEYLDETIDEEDKRRYEIFSFEGARKIVGLPFFKPDEWLQNLRLLEPVLTGQPKAKIPQHIQFRLAEMYRGFILNQWFSVIALSRTILEYTILNCSTRFEIDAVKSKADGKTEYWKLEKLVDLVSEKHPTIKDDMTTVRQAGNRIMHPKKHDVISHPHIIQKEALECLQGIKRVVEYAYAGGA